MIIPTILEETFTEVKKNVEIIGDDAPLIQIDIVDGKITDGKTFLNPSLLDSIQTDTTFELDLMVENPQDYVKSRILSVFKVCANIKATNNIPDFIKRAKNLDYVVGISVDLDTPLELLEPLLSEIDYVQFMSVVPGSQGKNKFNKKVITQIKEFTKKHPTMEIQVDGNINEETIKNLLDLNVKDYVVGSAIFNAEDPVESYKVLKGIANDNTNNLFSIAG